MESLYSSGHQEPRKAERMTSSSMVTLADEKYGYPHLHILYNMYKCLSENKCNGKKLLQYHSKNHKIGMMMYIWHLVYSFICRESPHANAHIHIHANIHTHTHTNVYTNMYMHKHTHEYTHIHMDINIQMIQNIHK